MAYPVCSEDGEVEAVLEFVRKKGNNFSDYDTEVWSIFSFQLSNTLHKLN